MKKIAVAVVAACMLISASSAASAAAPMTEKKHETMHHKHAGKAHKLHAKSNGKMKMLETDKKLSAKDVTKLPKTGFGGASEQTE
ncbi:hypothetical protein [Cohnella sp. 56]|uniref:hypothetical protein n=1 Tax=Cohnella sp. 56 TaxID=3113722 RepID=UPI0030EACF40